MRLARLVEIEGGRTKAARRAPNRLVIAAGATSGIVEVERISRIERTQEIVD